MVLRRCRALLKHEEAAHDAMQDVFVNLVKHGDRLVDAGLSSLLFRMATNTCLNHLRSARRRPEDPGDELLQQIAQASQPGGLVEARSFLASLFQAVPSNTGLIAVLHLVDGMTLEEVAREVGMSVSGVRKRLRQLDSLLGKEKGLSS